MACDFVPLPGGGQAIVCSGHKRARCSCGAPATLECDWKVPRRRSGTCDAPICSICATSPAPDKDLCPDHGRAYADWVLTRNQGVRPYG